MNGQCALPHSVSVLIGSAHNFSQSHGTSSHTVSELQWRLLKQTVSDSLTELKVFSALDAIHGRCNRCESFIVCSLSRSNASSTSFPLDSTPEFT